MRRRIYLSADGGGSKLRMILFDEDFRILGEGLSGGISMTQASEQDVRVNIGRCVEEVFSRTRLKAIDKFYCIMVGRSSSVFLLDAMKVYCPVTETIYMSEGSSGLLAGALWRSGLLALSGTGSNVFYVPGDSPIHVQEKSGTITWSVGGWGSILGDQGSGVWIGQQAIQRAIAGMEGWAEPTNIMELIRRDWKPHSDKEIINMVYNSPAPFRKVASLTMIVEEAAYSGDQVAMDILTEAGKLMAVQTLCLKNRHNIPEVDERLVTCGGAWKTHRLFFETFKEEIAVKCPALKMRRQRFEQVMAGPAQVMLEFMGESRADEAEEQLAFQFPAYEIRWKG